MKYLELPPSPEPRKLPFYFAVEEYVATRFNDAGYFFAWQVPPTVMLGRNQLADNEVDLSFCRSHGIDIFRRKSGGGCVFADEGCLQFSYIVPDESPAEAFRRYMQTTADVLRAAGADAELSGRNDILIDGRKVAGAAFYRTGRRCVMHNTLLYSTDLDLLEKALTPPMEKLESKGVASVRDRVGNAGGAVGLPIPDFIAFARKQVCGNEVRHLTEEDLAQIRLIEGRLGSDAFVYGHNPRYSLVRQLHVPDVGRLEAFIEVKGGRIIDFDLAGDYFLIGDLDNDLVARLSGVPFNREAVTGALADIPLPSIIRNLESDAFLRLLFGRKPHVPKPEWLKVSLSTNRTFRETEDIIERNGLHTICRSGLCPNRGECWRAGTATFMIGGDICTRSCRFCNTKSGRPLPLDATEPRQVARSIRLMHLRYAVLTSVDRDDLPDLGAAHWARTIEAVRRENPDTRIEVLIPDFQGRTDLVDQILATSPDVVGHNMETVRRLTPSVRSAARYDRSLDVLRHIAEAGSTCKTGFMVGLGETADEVDALLDDIRATGCRSVTIGQYLQPTSRHLDVVEYVTPEQFDRYRATALDKGFTRVVSGPLVRSSYHAGEDF